MREDVPSVSIIVPHYNDLDGLGACVASLLDLDYPRAAIEIIVCDNASPIDRAAIAKVVEPMARLVVEPRKGAGAARNAGQAVASHQILAFIDSDCRADRQWLRRMVDALERGSIVGGDVRIFSERRPRSGADVFEQVFAFNQKDYIEKKGFSVTANLAMRRATFDDVGEFMVGPSEDVEWCHRARARGHSLIHEPAAVVHHPTRPDWRSLRAKWDRISRETFELHILRGGSRAAWVVRAPMVALSALPHSWRILGARGFTLAERWAGLRTLWRIRFWRAAKALTLLRSREGERS